MNTEQERIQKLEDQLYMMEWDLRLAEKKIDKLEGMLLAVMWDMQAGMNGKAD